MTRPLLKICGLMRAADVMTGVETAPGEKSEEKLRALLAAMTADR